MLLQGQGGGVPASDDAGTPASSGQREAGCQLRLLRACSAFAAWDFVLLASPAQFRSLPHTVTLPQRVSGLE